MDERGRIALLERLFRPLAGHDVAIGVGDDAAVVRLADEVEPLVCSVDAVIEGSHFERGWLGFDDLGFKAVRDIYRMRDVHATVLHLMGLNDMRLTHYHGGRNMRLTDTGGRVIKEALS